MDHDFQMRVFASLEAIHRESADSKREMAEMRKEMAESKREMAELKNEIAELTKHISASNDLLQLLFQSRKVISHEHQGHEEKPRPLPPPTTFPRVSPSVPSSPPRPIPYSSGKSPISPLSSPSSPPASAPSSAPPAPIPIAPSPVPLAAAPAPAPAPAPATAAAAAPATAPTPAKNLKSKKNRKQNRDEAGDGKHEAKTEAKEAKEAKEVKEEKGEVKEAKEAKEMSEAKQVKEVFVEDPVWLEGWEKVRNMFLTQLGQTDTGLKLQHLQDLIQAVSQHAKARNGHAPFMPFFELATRFVDHCIKLIERGADGDAVRAVVLPAVDTWRVLPLLSEKQKKQMTRNRSRVVDAKPKKQQIVSTSLLPLDQFVRMPLHLFAQIMPHILSHNLITQSLTEEISDLYVRNTVPPVIQQSRRAMIQHLMEVTQQDMPGSQLLLYGSVACELDCRSSDVDLTLLPPPSQADLPAPDVLKKLMNVLKKRGWKPKDLYLITRGRVPVLKITCIHEKLSINMDITVRSVDQLMKASLMREYVALDRRVRILFTVVRAFFERYELLGADVGRLNCFSIKLMLLHFLQCIQPPVLPCIHPTTFLQAASASASNPSSSISDILNIRNSFAAHNEMSLGELLLHFFHYYASFPFESGIVNIVSGRPEQESHTREGQLRFIQVEDPFDHTDNTARHIRKEIADEIIYSIRLAFSFLADGGSLKDLLFTKNAQGRNLIFSTAHSLGLISV
eukprot:TRINITY_DN7136_c0_g2_i5.p1 TRINITY_DN7136_c0_g2~~TRINITY_DN7136_c0_g2_i5.p1  ORF type:complete len:735 (-),score=235.97 TRINITY_DN7136_c0_g2_i5:76-2280(-)